MDPPKPLYDNVARRLFRAAFSSVQIMDPLAVLSSANEARPAQAAPLLAVEDLHVHFASARGVVRAVDGVSWSIHAGETVALVGESGCGKSVSALALMRLLPQSARVAGRILFERRELLALAEDDMRALRGREIAMIFQEPMTALNPVLSLGLQLMEPLIIHLGLSQGMARKRAVELLERVGIPDPERRLGQFPHQLSGGMRQRAMIAIALACHPKLIIADEPTTALDVTLQAQILQLIRDLSRERGIAMLMITHNLGIVARYADRVNIMYAARLAEHGPAQALFAQPFHPYTAGLLRSVPRLDRPRGEVLETIEGAPPDLRSPPPGCRFAPRCAFRLEACQARLPDLEPIAPDHSSACIRTRELVPAGALGAPSAALPSISVKTVASRKLVQVRGLKTHFKTGGGWFTGSAGVVRAVDDVSFDIQAGETLGLVGESGCGKTTLGRTLLRLERETAGSIHYDGIELTRASQGELRQYRHRAQAVFQDPYSSLNPRMTVGEILAEPLLVHRLASGRREARVRVAELLEQVGLFEHMVERYPHQLSGGQRQRVGIARALAMQPEFIVCDEPVSALDVSIQAQIINLLERLQRELRLTYLFIAHDLAVVRHISDRVAVMYRGRFVELADRDSLYGDPLHPYTRALLEAVPIPDPAIERARARPRLPGEAPSPHHPPQGCLFQPRCSFASDECRRKAPELREVKPGHFVACINV